MNRQTKPLKPYHGILVLILAAICVFFIGPFLGTYMGLYGTLVSELLLLGIAVGCTYLFKGNLRYVFPVRKPTACGLFGTFLFWMGVIGITMVFTMLLAYFFPAQIMGTSSELSYAFMSTPALISVLIVSIAPAFCEEAVFRGVVFNSFWPIGNKWVVIVLTGCIFGAFHGSIWRFLPTAILGMALAYILAETGNMVYCAVFHAVNNLLPLLMMFGMQILMQILSAVSGGYADAAIYGSMTAASMNIPFASVGIYIAGSGISLFLLYIGNFLLHKGKPGYEGKLFEGKRKKHLYILLIVTAALFIIGCISIAGSVFMQGVGRMMYQR